MNAELADYDALATEWARRLRPKLDPTAGPGAARTYRSFVRHLSVAIECNDLRAAGVRDAAKVIADRRSLTASAVRVLLHRASTTHGITITDKPATPSLEGALQIVADWYASSEGRDVLVDELTAAGYTLPEATR